MIPCKWSRISEDTGDRDVIYNYIIHSHYDLSHLLSTSYCGILQNYIYNIYGGYIRIHVQLWRELYQKIYIIEKISYVLLRYVSMACLRCRLNPL